MKRTRRKGGKSRRTRTRTRKRRTPRRKQKGGTPNTTPQELHTPIKNMTSILSLPIVFNGSEVPTVIDGSEVPTVIDGSEVPTVIDGSIIFMPSQSLSRSNTLLTTESEPQLTLIETPGPNTKTIQSPRAPEKATLRKEFNDFPLDIVVKQYKQLSTNSKNGDLTKLRVQNKVYLFKTPKQTSDYFKADNLMYEYLIGLFLNKYVEQFPSIVRTLTLLEKGNLIANDELNINANTCEKANSFSLITDFFDDSQTLEDLLGEDEKYDIITFADLAKIYYQIYGPLAALDGHFSHNDLHLRNIMVKTLSEPVTFKYIHGKNTVTFTTKYLAKMIDYGRGIIHGISLQDFFYPGGKPELVNLKACGLSHLLFLVTDAKRLGMDNLEDILDFLKHEINLEQKEKENYQNSTVTIDITPINEITSKITPMKFSDSFNRNIKPFFLYEDESVNKNLDKTFYSAAVKPPQPPPSNKRKQPEYPPLPPSKK
jgi:hypothetical protein